MYKKWNRLILISVMAAVLVGGCRTQEAAQVNEKTIKLFNGKDLGNFYTFLKGRGRDNDPNKVFTVKDGMIRISGDEFGCITTKQSYENYHLIAEFKWGEHTSGTRIDKARDSGILLNSVGEDGAHGGIWMRSIEAQMIEGGTGDFIVIGDGSDKFFMTAPVSAEKVDSSYQYNPNGKLATIHGAGTDIWRINWQYRDTNWKDVKGFRGKNDVEKPAGQWNRYECIVKGQTIQLILNGVTVNRCVDVWPRSGKIQIQSEYAEVFFRRFDLIPLEE